MRVANHAAACISGPAPHQATCTCTRPCPALPCCCRWRNSSDVRRYAEQLEALLHLYRWNDPQARAKTLEYLRNLGRLRFDDHPVSSRAGGCFVTYVLIWTYSTMLLKSCSLRVTSCN